jgi:hypothetical protein
MYHVKIVCYKRKGVPVLSYSHQTNLWICNSSYLIQQKRNTEKKINLTGNRMLNKQCLFCAEKCEERWQFWIYHVLSSTELWGIYVDFRLKSQDRETEKVRGFVYLNNRKGKTKIACSETRLSHVHQKSSTNHPYENLNTPNGKLCMTCSCSFLHLYV